MSILYSLFLLKKTSNAQITKASKSLRKSDHVIHSFFPLFSLKLFFLLLICLLTACTMPIRTGYDRKIGDYKPIPKPQTASSESSVSNTSKKDNSEISKKASIKKTAEIKNNSKKSFEEFIKPWLGTRYKFGGASRSGTDCSGYVMQIYKTKLNINLPHNAAAMYKMGGAVKFNQWKEGDLIFFGNLWGINHVGIYLNGNRFTHASSSQGVTITPMETEYWKSRYKGARRLIE